MMGNYILRNNVPVLEPNIIAWALWFESNDKIVEKSRFIIDNKIVEVSTVFLGIDHSFHHGPPLLFETMIFGGKHDQEIIERYSTYPEAVEGHSWAVSLIHSEIE